MQCKLDSLLHANIRDVNLKGSCDCSTFVRTAWYSRSMPSIFTANSSITPIFTAVSSVTPCLESINHIHSRIQAAAAALKPVYISL